MAGLRSTMTREFDDRPNLGVKLKLTHVSSEVLRSQYFDREVRIDLADDLDGTSIGEVGVLSRCQYSWHRDVLNRFHGCKWFKVPRSRISGSD